MCTSPLLFNDKNNPALIMKAFYLPTKPTAFNYEQLLLVKWRRRSRFNVTSPLVPMTLCHADRCWAVLNIITQLWKKKKMFEREGRINLHLDAIKQKIIFLLGARWRDQLLQDRFWLRAARLSPAPCWQKCFWRVGFNSLWKPFWMWLDTKGNFNQEKRIQSVFHLIKQQPWP